LGATVRFDLVFGLVAALAFGADLAFGTALALGAALVLAAGWDFGLGLAMC
jgi:hypothetical protein